LIVDDSPVNRIVARQLLLADLPKLHIDEAADGEEGLNMAERGDYAVVLMDVVMPKMDGIQATQAIRSSALSQQPMIIGLTANVTGETRSQALASGMDMVIGKPYSREQLVQSVARQLRGQPAKP
jgi:CheY-like chemotaxis protein